MLKKCISVQNLFLFKSVSRKCYALSLCTVEFELIFSVFKKDELISEILERKWSTSDKEQVDQ